MDPRRTAPLAALFLGLGLAGCAGNSRGSEPGGKLSGGGGELSGAGGGESETSSDVGSAEDGQGLEEGASHDPGGSETNPPVTTTSSAAETASSVGTDDDGGVPNTTTGSDSGADPDWPSPGAEVWELRVADFPVPLLETTYVPHFFSVVADGPVHIVGFEAALDPESPATPLHHHWRLFQGDALVGTGETGLIWGWAPGGQPFALPEQAGIPVGPGKVDFTLEVHYNNPLSQSAVDQNGLNIYYVRDLRQYDAVMCMAGAVGGHIVPPGIPNHELVLPLAPSMLQPITVFGVWHHAHDIGKALWTNHLRGGQFLGEIGRHDPYEFEGQHIEDVWVDVMPGDVMELHCIYDSTSRTGPTPFGAATREEMCLNLFMFYPAQALGICS